MTVTKINLRAFKLLCEEARDDYERAVSYGDDVSFKDALKEVAATHLSWKESDEWLAQQAETPATLDEIVSCLRMASVARMQHGATDAQIVTIAKMAVRDRLPLHRIACTTLTRGEAAAIIVG